MNALYQELNTLSNRDLAQVSQVCTSRVHKMAEEILSHRFGRPAGYAVAPGTRLNPVYLRHLDITFG